MTRGRIRMQESLLIYDGDCGFCRRCVDVAVRRLAAPVRCRPYQRTDLGSVGLTLDQARQAVWWVGDDGSVRRGHRAVAAVLRAQPGRFWRTVGRVIDNPPLSWVAAGAYTLVARWRHLLPGGTAQCALSERPVPRGHRAALDPPNQ